REGGPPRRGSGPPPARSPGARSVRALVLLRLRAAAYVGAIAARVDARHLGRPRRSLVRRRPDAFRARPAAPAARLPADLVRLGAGEDLDPRRLLRAALRLEVHAHRHALGELDPAERPIVAHEIGVRGA